VYQHAFLWEPLKTYYTTPVILQPIVVIRFTYFRYMPLKPSVSVCIYIQGLEYKSQITRLSSKKKKLIDNNRDPTGKRLLHVHIMIIDHVYADYTMKLKMNVNRSDSVSFPVLTIYFLFFSNGFPSLFAHTALTSRPYVSKSVTYDLAVWSSPCPGVACPCPWLCSSRRKKCS
jgi:hypothetical protein